MQSDDPHTFHPVISDTSHLIAKNNELYRGDNKDFLARQNEYKARQIENREKLRDKYSEEVQHSFKPQINMTSEVICAADPDRGHESKEEKINRLYTKDQMKRQVERELKQDIYNSEYTFQPKINPISAKIAPESSLLERT